MEHMNIYAREVQYMVGYLYLFLLIYTRYAARNNHKWFTRYKDKMTNSEYKRRHIDDMMVIFIFCLGFGVAWLCDCEDLSVMLMLSAGFLNARCNMQWMVHQMKHHTLETQLLSIIYIVAGLLIPRLLAVAIVIEVLDIAIRYLGLYESIHLRTILTKPEKIMSIPSLRSIIAVTAGILVLVITIFGCTKIISIIVTIVAIALIALALVHGGKKNDDHV